MENRYSQEIGSMGREDSVSGAAEKVSTVEEKNDDVYSFTVVNRPLLAPTNRL